MNINGPIKKRAMEATQCLLNSKIEPLTVNPLGCSDSVYKGKTVGGGGGVKMTPTKGK